MSNLNQEQAARAEALDRAAQTLSAKVQLPQLPMVGALPEHRAAFEVVELAAFIVSGAVGEQFTATLEGGDQ